MGVEYNSKNSQTLNESTAPTFNFKYFFQQLKIEDANFYLFKLKLIFLVIFSFLYIRIKLLLYTFSILPKVQFTLKWALRRRSNPTQLYKTRPKGYDPNATTEVSYLFNSKAMLFFFEKSHSRTVVHHDPEEEEQEEEFNNCSHSNNVKNVYEEEEAICLTVWRKSLVFSCKGFTVIGDDGSLVYRVDNYNGRPEQVVLMDGSGNPIFTICRRKKLSLVDNYWLVYDGDAGETISRSSKKPIFWVKKNMSLVQQTKPNAVLAHVFTGMSGKRYAYAIEGSYGHRSCKVFDGWRRNVAEIKRKEEFTRGVKFGVEVFELIVKPAMESSVAMAIVLLLDQMFS